MFTAPRELWPRQRPAPQLTVFLGPAEEPRLLRDNTALASGVICIVVWSWRTASSREPSACFKRPGRVGHGDSAVGGRIAFIGQERCWAGERGPPVFYPPEFGGWRGGGDPMGAIGRGQAVARCGMARAVGRPWSVVGCRWILDLGIAPRLLTTRYCLRATALRPEGVRPWFAAAGARTAEDGGRRAEDGRRRAARWGQAVNC